MVNIVSSNMPAPISNLTGKILSENASGDFCNRRRQDDGWSSMLKGIIRSTLDGWEGPQRSENSQIILRYFPPQNQASKAILWFPFPNVGVH